MIEKNICRKARQLNAARKISQGRKVIICSQTKIALEKNDA